MKLILIAFVFIVSSIAQAEIVVTYSTSYTYEGDDKEIKTQFDEKSCIFNTGDENSLYVENTHFVIGLEPRGIDSIILRIYTRPESRTYNQIAWFSNFQITTTPHTMNFGNATNFNFKDGIDDFNLSIGIATPEETKDLNVCENNFFELPN